MDEDLASLYDAWATDYDAAHSDWRSAVVQHGEMLAASLADRGMEPGARVLDCTCGIGTQAIGLALAGYRVAGTDLSPAQIERAKMEAQRFGVVVDFAVADLLCLAADLPPGPAWAEFDAVVSANSLTHFADDGTLAAAFAAMASVARPGGVVAVTNRDYDLVVETRPPSTAVQHSIADGVRRVSFQLWDWSEDGTSYRMEDVLLTRSATAGTAVAWQVRSRATTLRTWQRVDIERAANVAGLVDVEWTQRGHQPIATFRRPC
jgi:glycine/sarcosine N-methyltransferase